MNNAVLDRNAEIKGITVMLREFGGGRSLVVCGRAGGREFKQEYKEFGKGKHEEALKYFKEVCNKTENGEIKLK